MISLKIETLNDSFYFSNVIDQSLDEHFLRLQIHRGGNVHHYVFPVKHIEYMKMIEPLLEKEETLDDS